MESKCCVCSQPTKKYTCKECRSRICSLPCFKEHTGTAECARIAEQLSTAKTKEKAASGEEVVAEDDGISLSTLQKERINASERVREFLELDDVKRWALEIASARRPEMRLMEALTSPDFLLFSEVLLREIGVRETSEELLKEEDELRRRRQETPEDYLLRKLSEGLAERE